MIFNFIKISDYALFPLKNIFSFFFPHFGESTQRGIGGWKWLGRGVFIFMLITFACKAAAQGIMFESITFDEALVKAKTENKLIFIDFYTQWCGPCKLLAAGPFKNDTVGAFYNKHFINLTLDAEKEGTGAAKRYNVSRYPTLMFVNGDGKIVYQGTGSNNGEHLVDFAQEALKSQFTDFSLEKLKQEFPHKQNDETFLKFYFQKMIEYGVSPTDGIEAWLGVQTEIKEQDIKMMHFLLKNQSFLIANGKAWSIINTHQELYNKSLTEREKFQLESCRANLLKNTLKKARATQNPELLKLYIDIARDFKSQFTLTEDLNWLEAECLLMQKNYSGYMSQIKNYTDSLTTTQSISEIKNADAKTYQIFSKKYLNDTTLQGRAALAHFKMGANALKRVELLVAVTKYTLPYCKNKSDFSMIRKWLDYCNKLIPDYFLTNDLKANWLYAQGKKKQAIALKQKALANTPRTFKKISTIQYEFDLMQKGEVIFKNNPAE